MVVVVIVKKKRKVPEKVVMVGKSQIWKIYYTNSRKFADLKAAGKLKI